MDIRETNVHPGPFSRDVLVLGPGEHRCDVVWADEAQATVVLKCHRTCSSLYANSLIVNRHERVVQILRDYRFYGVERVGGLQLDWALITALVERWRPETHSFHLPFGEVGITLQDVELLLGLPVDGIPLTGVTSRTREQWKVLCDDLLGFRPTDTDLTSSTIKMSAIIPKTLTGVSGDVDYVQHARDIMFKLLGGSLFPNTTGNKVSLYLLEILHGDAQLVRGRAIGSAVLGFLYRNLCRASLAGVAQIGGCLVLLQLWTWERLPMTRPRGIVPLEQLVDVSYGVKWVCYHRWSDCTTHSLRAYRDQLDRLLEGEFVWMPYPDPQTLPDYCSAGLRIWISRLPLIYAYVVELYYPDRFCRQFGALQDVPQHVPYDRDLHRVKSTVMEISDGQRQYLQNWEDRYGASVQMTFGMVASTTEYRAWYSRHGRRLIEDEEDISSEEEEEDSDNEVHQNPSQHHPQVEHMHMRGAYSSFQPAFHIPNIEVGFDYPSFQSLQQAVSLRNIAEHRHFHTEAKRNRYWRAVCVYAPQCTWFIQAAELANTTIWTIKQYQGYHQCRPDYTRAKDDKLLTSELISSLIGPKIEEDVDYKVKLIMRDIYELFQISVSYKKTWCARLIAIQRLYGSWEGSYNKLAPLLNAIMSSNHGTIVDLQTIPSITPATFQFRYVFWSLKASIEGFHYCLPVVSVDGTHLYGKYKGTLLIAVAMTANHDIFPLAFSIVDVEDGNSWRWFLTNVMRHIVPPHRHICIISDRHAGIAHAFEHVPELQAGRVTRTYCLRHLRSNFQKKFRSKKLKNLMYKAGEAPTRREFDEILLQIASKNQAAYEWLMAIPKHMWALSHDEGGSRYGIMTTNLSESYNNVLKGCQCLPVYAIVKFTYDRLVKIFADRQTNGYLWQQSGYKFPMNVWNDLKKKEENRLHCRVVQHHAQNGIYCVIVGGSYNVAQRETFTVNLNARTCSCGEWATLHIPCIHVHAICHYCSVMVDHLIPNIYSIESYINAYSGIIMSLPDEAEWPIPGYEIVNPTPRARTPTGRRTRTRYPNNIDYRSRRGGND